MLFPGFHAVWDRYPLKVEPPVETPSHHGGGLVLEGVAVDDVDDGADHSMGIVMDTVQQWLQPFDIDLLTKKREAI